MKKKYYISLFIFRRDLRLFDNTGLIKAIEQSDFLIPLFIIDPRQIGKNNKYKSQNALQFMAESLTDLERNLTRLHGKLFYFHGIPETIIELLIKNELVNAVFCNRDYTSFSINRDEAIKNICLQNNVDFNQYPDALLTEPEQISTLAGTPFSKFTPFFKKASLMHISSPNKLSKVRFIKKLTTKKYKTTVKQIRYSKNKDISARGGRKYGLLQLNNVKYYSNYLQTKDIPSIDTTHLSAHLKFGTVSIREAYHVIKNQLGSNHCLIRQLFWRDFFTHIAYHSPFVFGSACIMKYNNVPWEYNKTKFFKWCTGNTGFPIIDAGMKQLNQTGFMHNRVRMLTASFLTKDLHIDWRWGEQYFAQQLVDYDPAVNNGNWQWVASTGCDAQPYFRIFNPWLQQKKFDPDCVYIKQWIPELKTQPAHVVHNWFDYYNIKVRYPKPMLDHKKESDLVKKIFKKMYH